MGQTKLTNTDYSQNWPASLQRAAKAASLQNDDWQPVVVRMSETSAEQKLEELLDRQTITEVNDNYDEQLAELFISQNAQLYRANPEVKASSIADYLQEHYGENEPWRMGSWVYFPWDGRLVHILAEDLFWALRTIRNKNLITEEEQAKYAAFRAGCLGMSVGSSGAVALTLQGGSSQIKIADGAVMSGSNLNRVRTGINSVGKQKSVIIARQMYEMNPYISVHRFDTNVTKANLDEFFAQPWPLDVVIDEIDDLETKILVRVEARRRGLPVLMATDLGDDIMMDIERFDQDNSLPLFHGLVGNIEEVLDRTDMTQREWLKYATQIIGTKNVPLRMQQSLLQVGTKLPTQPQLGGTVMMAGAVIAYAVRQLATGGPLKNGRHMISLDRDLVEGYGDRAHRKTHAEHTDILDRAMGSM